MRDLKEPVACLIAAFNRTMTKRFRLTKTKSRLPREDDWGLHFERASRAALAEHAMPRLIQRPIVAALFCAAVWNSAVAQTRNYYDQPGGNGSAWNTPFGDRATWGLATDPDTIDIGRGWNGYSYTAGPVGVINSVSNFGNTYYVGKASDAVYRFSANNGRTKGIDSCATLSATLHVPIGAIAPGPYPGDNAIILADPVNAPGRQYTFGGVQIPPPGLKPGQGPFFGSLGEWDDARSDRFGEDADTGLSGFNVGAGLITGYDTDPVRNPAYPRIRHGLRYSTDAHLLKDNASPARSQTLKPNSWPQRLQDKQNGIDLYSGNLKAGTTLGIPLSTIMPAGLSSSCQGLFWTMQHYPLFFRDQAGGGFHLTVDQVADTSAYISDARRCLPQLVALLRPLRNHHRTGQSFIANPKNGPGARVDVGPPPLAGLAGSVQGLDSPFLSLCAKVHRATPHDRYLPAARLNDRARDVENR